MLVVWKKRASEKYLYLLSLSFSLKSGALMFQHADFGERTGPPVPVPLVLLLQSLSCASGRRTSSGAGAGGATVFKDGDFNLDSHSQGLNAVMLKYNNQKNLKTSFNCLMSLVSYDVIFPFLIRTIRGVLFTLMHLDLFCIQVTHFISLCNRTNKLVLLAPYCFLHNLLSYSKQICSYII